MENKKQQGESGYKRFANSILTLVYRDGDLHVREISYRSLWGIAANPIQVSESLTTKTPQNSFTLGRSILVKGTDVITESKDFKESAFICRVGNVWDGVFNRKDKSKGQYNFPIIGLDNVQGFAVAVNKGNIELTLPNGSKLNKTIAEIEKEINDFFIRENKRIENDDF